MQLANCTVSMDRYCTQMLYLRYWNCRINEIILCSIIKFIAWFYISLVVVLQNERNENFWSCNQKLAAPENICSCNWNIFITVTKKFSINYNCNWNHTVCFGTVTILSSYYCAIVFVSVCLHHSHIATSGFPFVVFCNYHCYEKCYAWAICSFSRNQGCRILCQNA